MTIFRDTHLVEKSVQRGFMSGTQIIEISEAVRAKVLGVSAVALFFFFSPPRAVEIFRSEGTRS